MEVIYHSNLQLTVKYKQAEDSGENSAYLERFRENLIKSVQKDAWKYMGQGAQFQGRYYGKQNTACELSINSISSFDSESYIYSAAASGQGDTISAIIKKNYSSSEEQYIYHGNKERFYAIDFDGKKRIAVSLDSVNNIARNIAVYKIDTNDLFSITDGDTMDDNPSFSKTGPEIFFDSRGIGRDAYMNPVDYSESIICSVTESGSLEEILAEKGFDLFMPKNDTDGNLYYIKKPHKNRITKRGKAFLDALLFPYWLLAGVGRVLVFLANLSKKSDKKAQNTTSGSNPSIENIKSERDIYIQNERIDIEQEEKKNLKLGVKNPGFAPKSFELWKKTLSGEQKLLIKGLLSYDITPDNKIVYTNGRYIFLKDGEKETVLLKDRFIKSLAAKTDKTAQKACFTEDPFNMEV